MIKDEIKNNQKEKNEETRSQQRGRKTKKIPSFILCAYQSIFLPQPLVLFTKSRLKEAYGLVELFALEHMLKGACGD